VCHRTTGSTGTTFKGCGRRPPTRAARPRTTRTRAASPPSSRPRWYVRASALLQSPAVCSSDTTCSCFRGFRINMFIQLGEESFLQKNVSVLTTWQRGLVVVVVSIVMASEWRSVSFGGERDVPPYWNHLMFQTLKEAAAALWGGVFTCLGFLCLHICFPPSGSVSLLSLFLCFSSTLSPLPLFCFLHYTSSFVSSSHLIIHHSYIWLYNLG